MTFTKKEEDILKKIVEVEKTKESYRKLSREYAANWNSLTAPQKQQLSGDFATLNSKGTELQTKKEELNTLLGA